MMPQCLTKLSSASYPAPHPLLNLHSITTTITEVKQEKPEPKCTCIVLHLVSQGRAVKAYGLEVKAPTGHRSITFPDSSDLKSFSTYVPTCMSLPLPVVPKSSTPATSLANL